MEKHEGSREVLVSTLSAVLSSLQNVQYISLF